MFVAWRNHNGYVQCAAGSGVYVQMNKGLVSAGLQSVLSTAGLLQCIQVLHQTVQIGHLLVEVLIEAGRNGVIIREVRASFAASAGQRRVAAAHVTTVQIVGRRQEELFTGTAQSRHDRGCVVDVILRAILQTAQSGQRGQWRRWSGYTEALQCVSGACARRPLAGHVNGCVRRTGAAVGDVRRRRGVGQHGVIGDDRVRRGGGGA